MKWEVPGTFDANQGEQEVTFAGRHFRLGVRQLAGRWHWTVVGLCGDSPLAVRLDGGVAHDNEGAKASAVACATAMLRTALADLEGVAE